ncbi:uncharacterized protein FYW47_015000 [Aplochiton taeniatus]
MLSRGSDGVEVPKLCAQYKHTYGRQLTLAEYGLGGLQELLAVLGDSVCVERLDKKNVVCLVSLRGLKDQENARQAGPTGEKKKAVLSEMEKTCRDIVSMMKKHPEGILLKKLAVAYSQEYHCNLTLASLGFDSMASLVASLETELYVEGELVFHNNPTAETPAQQATEKHQKVTPRRPRSRSGKDPPQTPVGPGSHYGPPSTAGISFGASPAPEVPPFASPLLSISKTSKQTEELTQEQLLARIKEVMKGEPAAATTMKLLETGYFQRFGEPLPMQQYMSLYDSQTDKKQANQASSTTPKGKTKSQKPAGPSSPCPPPATLPASMQPLVPVSDSDFPALGAETKLTKAQERKLNAKPQREVNGPIFKEAYQAQLREVHGANVRAEEVLAEEEDSGATVRWRRNRRKTLDADTVNSLVEDVIREIASEGEHVTLELVIYRVCRLMQVPSLEAGGIKSQWQLQALKDFQRNVRAINMFIESAESVTAVCTLYELGQSLAALKNKKRFEELNMGPLCKVPLIHRIFKIDSNTKDDDVPQIGTVDILRSLRSFRSKTNKAKVDLADFMKHLADQYSCDSPYELGIRIQGLGLPISSLMSVVRNEHTLLERAREVIQREVEEEVYEKMRKMKKVLMEPAQSPILFSSVGSSDLRKKYVSLPAAEAVLEVFTNAGGVFNPMMTKRVQDFLLQVSGDRLARALFQLAICGGSLATPKDLVPKDKPSSGAEDKPRAAPPSQDSMKLYLKEILSNQNSALTLVQMAGLERKLNKHFQVTEFNSLEQGTFLEFLVKQIQVLQETVGGAVSLSSGSVEGLGCGFRPSRQDVFEFIKQCGAVASPDPDALSHIECALRAHYGVRDSCDLGFGPLRTLASLVQRQRDMPGGGGLSQVFYESALFAKDPSSNGRVGEAVGLLGEMSKTQAVASLLSCPLLEDISQWSQWELVFRSTHGPLKDFIDRNAANSDLATLEVAPGVLVRITTATGDKLFSQASMALDPVNTAGHLVSMVVADGIANAPTALLANHMESSLAAAVAKEDVSPVEEDGECYTTVTRFLLDCLIRIPTRTCQALLQQVFLEPFSRVLGQTKSKAVLLCTARSNYHYLNRVHHLGIVLGITDWVRDYHTKLSPPHQPPSSLTVRTEHRKLTPVDSVSSSLSALNLTEDEDEDLEEPSSIVDDSLDSPHLNHTQDQENVEEDEEELYELTSVPNGETSSDVQPPGESEGNQEEGERSSGETEEADADSSPAGRAEGLQRAIVDDIRKSEFGIGVELNAEGQRLMTVSQERLGRSLDRLSTELYSKDTHFVLELIQNADDNSYPDGTEAMPALAFVVERDCVTVLNNESGFQERNIRAICDVGRSTKGKHKCGYIGQKGIGFKSVFKVTDCPEIHSNGFHLRFDKTSGPMGYILPHWVEDESTLETRLCDLPQQSWTTKICLPLRSESYQTRNLFHDVHPSLLLFLHRLRSITIYNQSERRVVTMTRRDLSHNVLEVEHTEGTERWLVVKRTLQPKKIKEDVESTELALAFQLSDQGSDALGQPQKQPVFAYLPLRSFGFRFIVQGDFDIPSSREDVDRDSSWNQWLRSEIPQLFLHSMDVFTDHPDFSGLSGLCHFLQFVPLPDEVLDFFRPVAGQIIQLLKGKAFLPTLTSDGGVEYKLPSQVAVCQDGVIRDVIGGEELDRHLSLAYLHPALHPAPPLSLLTHLGVRHLRGSDVTTVTTAMAKELMQGEGVSTDSGLRRLARLLVCNFRALEQGYGEAESLLQALRDLPLIPLSDGRVVALSEDTVFFPIEEDKSSRRKKGSKPQTGSLAALYSYVNVVNPSLLTCVEPLEGQQVRELLKRLGIHEMEPQQLLEQHIYPTLRSHAWKSKPEVAVVSYLVFIKQHASAAQEYSDIAVPVLTTRGLLCPGEDRVHFSKEYGNTDLCQKLPGCAWVLLSPCYVETDGDIAGWRELFSGLGVRDHLIIRKQRQKLTAKELASSPWSVECELWPGGAARAGGLEGGCELEDYPCEEFHSLATVKMAAPTLLEQRRALLELLETNWDTGDRYSQYLTAQLIDSEGRPIKPVKSSFFHFLSRLSWVPAYRLQEGGVRAVEYLCPNSVYLFSTEVHSLLGTHVYYLDSNPSGFTTALGMKHSLSVEELICYLKGWCVKTDIQEEDPPGEDSEGSEFTSTVEHIHTLYSYLHKNCSQSSLKELFKHTPVVFIEYNRRDEWCSGRFHHLKEVCWSDPTSMFKRYSRLTRGAGSTVQEPRVLAPFYGPLEGMWDLFKRLDVEPSPSINQYVGLLEMMCNSTPLPNLEVLRDVSVLYARLADKCKTPVSGDHEQSMQINPSYCSSLKGMLLDKKVFPTKENCWVPLSRRPMVPDSRELEKVFKAHQQVCLLNLAPADRKSTPRAKTGPQQGSSPAFSEEDRALFLDICGVRPLSRCVRTEAQTENYRPCPGMQALVRSVVPYIQRFLCHHEELFPLYQELLENGIAQSVRQLRYGQVGRLYICYQLSVSEEESVTEVEDVICLLMDQRDLYIQKDNLSAKLDVCRELVKLFSTETSHRKELMHFLSGLTTSLNDPDALKRFLQKEDVRELPSEEEPWEVPEPKQPETAPVPSREPTVVSTPEEATHHGQEDGEQTLICWPPKAPITNTGASRIGGHADSGAVEAVMKMWPPPAPPKPREPSSDVLSRGSSHDAGPHSPSMHQESQSPRSLDTPAVHPPRDHSQTGLPGPTANASFHPAAESSHERGVSGDQTTAVRRGSGDDGPTAPRSSQHPAPSNQTSVAPLAVVSSVFQGVGGVGDAQRPPLALDSPIWNKQQPSQATLEDLELNCQLPTTVVFSEDPGDLAVIGAWGEQLVNSFLSHWKDSDAPGRPSHVTWCNQHGESGQPYDFKLLFEPSPAGEGDQQMKVVYVEVKSTVKKERAFIHLSANELDFALKEKEKYHIFRVYNTGNAQNVRLCRIRNLAQHLHAKDLELFLFV